MRGRIIFLQMKISQFHSQEWLEFDLKHRAGIADLEVADDLGMHHADVTDAAGRRRVVRRHEDRRRVLVELRRPR